MMLTKGDDYPIHQTPEPIAYAGTDRNFYDRYFFNGYSNDGDLYFAVALGVYPHLNIIDAAFAVRIGERQYNLHASRHLGMERMDTQVGPIRVEVIAPLQTLRVVVEDNEHGIAAELVFQGRHAPIEEPRVVRRNGPRLVMDFTRMTQLGHWTGWLRAGGQEICCDTRVVHAARDRSWGIRHVGARDPQPLVPAQEPQFHWVWFPAIFADRVILFYANADADGRIWNQGLAICGEDGHVRHLPGATVDVTLEPGTRWPSRAVVAAPDGEGGAYRIEVEAGPKFFMSALGYLNPEWSHGIDKGPLAIGYDEIDVAAVTRYEAPYHYVQCFARVALVTPQNRRINGVGAFETLSFGPFAPLGLTGMFDAP